MPLTEMETTTRCVCCAERAGNVVMRTGDPYLRRPDTFEMVACRRCGLVRTRQLPADLARWYEEHYSRAQRVFRQSESRTKAGRTYRALDNLGVTRIVRKLNLNHHRFIAAQLPAAGSMLEVGCGAGEILRLLKRKGADVYGIEPHPDSAREAERHGIDILADRLESLPDVNVTFDTVLLAFSLEHTANPLAALARARTLLSPHGRLFVFTHNFACLSRYVFGESWSGWHLPYHTYLFTAETLGKLLVATGYRVQHARSYTRGDLLLESFRLALARRRGADVVEFARNAHLVTTLLCSALAKPFGWLGRGNALKVIAVPDSGRGGSFGAG
jgi:2-polyprenyl-3-methyl-5-hydroxy-6-metoxy-1,4-benzoquinol methylase